MGISEVVMLAIMGRTVVFGMALGTLMVPGYCRWAWAKLSPMQHTVHKAGSQAGNICGWPSVKYS